MFQKPSPHIALSSSEKESYPTPPSIQDDIETIVGPSVIVEGDFASEGNILVKGTVFGSVKTSQVLTVEKGAKILANIRAGSADISGEVKGDIKVNDKIELNPSARILGDIHCGILIVEAGALIQGKVNMKGINIESPKIEKKISNIRSRTTKTNSTTSVDA